MKVNVGSWESENNLLLMELLLPEVRVLLIANVSEKVKKNIILDFLYQ